jgi:hypothetical protein
VADTEKVTGEKASAAWLLNAVLIWVMGWTRNARSALKTLFNCVLNTTMR